MKKILLFLLIFLPSFLFPHKQHVHQYITAEGYKLLERTKILRYPEFYNNLGDTEGGSVGSIPWSVGKITTGAYREDIEDVVYYYSSANPPTVTGLAGQSSAVLSQIANYFNSLSEFHSSITHFWDPDNGDIAATDMETTLPILGRSKFTVPNAYQKMKKLANGGYDLRIPLITWHLPLDGTVSATNRTILYLRYNSLKDLYLNKNLYITKVVWMTLGQETVYSTPVRLKPENLVGLDHTTFCRAIVFEVLGRMCHLLQDMSVPTHVHRDAHGSDLPGIRHDDYEESFNLPATYGYDAYSVYAAYGGFLNPYAYNSTDPLHFLMYTTAQMADHFGSSGPYEGDGNNVLGGNPLSAELTYLNSVNVPSLGGNTVMKEDPTTEEIYAIRAVMIPQAIRATAGLLYWFANEVGLTTTPLSLAVSIGGTNNLYRGGSGNWYVTPKNSIPPYTYKWQYKYAGSVVEAAGESAQAAAGETSVIVRLPPPNTWLSIGSDSPTLSRPFNANNLQDFYVRCIVKDGLGKSVTSGSIFVDVINADPPPAENILFENLATIQEVAAEETIPENYTALQNYPNPFNPSTIIRYELPEAGNVLLKVYDMLGREVSVLVNEHKEAGRYESVFNASNLATGIYIYELRTNNFVSIKKMNFVK